jgi:hypothetical protein
MMGYRALEEAVSILKRYGREVARLLNQEHEDLNILRYQLYVFRRRACRRLERLGLAVREGWEVERGLAERGRGDYYEKVEGCCLVDGKGNVYVASVKLVFQVMEDGRRLWFEGVELGRAKVGSVDEVVAKITGGADDRGAEEEKRGKVRVRIIARIRVGGGMMRAQQHTMRMWMGRDMSCQRTRTYY